MASVTMYEFNKYQEQKNSNIKYDCTKIECEHNECLYYENGACNTENAWSTGCLDDIEEERD